MKVLLGAGNGMRVDDGDAFWTIGDKLEALGHEVRRVEAMQTLGAKRKMTHNDVQWAEACVVYSYAMATLWALQRDLGKAAGYAVLACIAGVNDAGIVPVPGISSGLWQDGSLWHPPQYVKWGICLQPTKAVPVSQPFRDTELWVDFGQEIPVVSRVNINCDALMAGMGPISQHVLIKDNAAVLEATTAWVHAAVSRLRNS